VLFDYIFLPLTVWHITIAVYTVLNSWWWTGNLSETSRVLSQKQIWEISSSLWFYYKNYVSFFGECSTQYQYVSLVFLYRKIYVGVGCTAIIAKEGFSEVCFMVRKSNRNSFPTKCIDFRLRFLYVNHYTIRWREYEKKNKLLQNV